MVSILLVMGLERLFIQALKSSQFKLGQFHSCIWNVSNGWFYKKLKMYRILLIILVHHGGQSLFLVNMLSEGTTLSVLLFLRPSPPRVVGLCVALLGPFLWWGASCGGSKQNSSVQLWLYVGPLERPIVIVWTSHFLRLFWISELRLFMLLLKGRFRPRGFIYLTECPSGRSKSSLA